MDSSNFFSSLQALFSLVRQRRFLELVSKAFQLWRRAGFAGIQWQLRLQWHNLYGYRHWIKAYGTLDDHDRQAIRTHVQHFSRRPLISVLMPTYNSPERWLKRAIESIRNQLYPHWELCIADDASPDPHVRELLESYRILDRRIKTTFRDCNGHISAASNSALDLAAGEFVALLDHDDELPEHALYMVAQAINDAPDAQLIYSDEDRINEQGRRFAPYFKPDWNPDLVTNQNMVSHLGVYRTDTLRSIGGFREGMEGSQDWDVALRMSEIIPAATIHHIPHILYHWRVIPGSTASGPQEKPYVSQAGLRAVQDHLQRLGNHAVAEPAFSSFVRVRYSLPHPPPKVSIFYAGNIGDKAEAALRAGYSSLEIVSLEQTPTMGNASSRAWWFNRAAQCTDGEILCFLSAQGLPHTNEWLEELASQACREGIGAVSPRWIDEDGALLGCQTVLVNQPDRVTWSYYRGFSRSERGLAGRAALQQNLTVLPPGCLVLRAKVFHEMGGFSETFPTLFAEDMCLRLDEAGYRNVWTPYSVLSIPSGEKVTPVASTEELSLFRKCWSSRLDHDRSHNPNVAHDLDWPFPAFPPRIEKPWRMQT